MEKEDPGKHKMGICTWPVLLDRPANALGQPTPEALILRSQLQPRSPLPVLLNTTVPTSSLGTVPVAVAELLSIPHQLAVDTVAIEQLVELL